MSVTPWTELEVEIFGTAGSFANPKPPMSIREALAQEVHSREQAVRSEATARAIADGEMMDRVLGTLAKNRAEIEAAAREIALATAQGIIQEAQQKSERIVAEAERRCMQALDARLERESHERREAAKKVDQSSFLRSALIMLFFSMCFAGMLYVQDSSGREPMLVHADLAPAPPVKDVAMQHAVSAHDVRLVKIESDRQAFVQRLNRAEAELAEALQISRQNTASIDQLGAGRSEAIQSALSLALVDHAAAAEQRDAARQEWVARADADLQALKEQLTKLQFMVPSFESHITQIEAEFRKQLSLSTRLDALEGGLQQHEGQVRHLEQDLARGEFLKRGFRVGDSQVQLNTDALICYNGYTRVGDLCLMLSDSEKAFSDARAYCRLTGGDLAVAQSDADWSAVAQLVSPDSPAWLGLQRREQDGRWEWLNGLSGSRGDTAGFHRWTSQNSDGSGRCAVALGAEDGVLAMDHADCATPRRFLCQYGGTIGFEKLTSYYNRA